MHTHVDAQVYAEVPYAAIRGCLDRAIARQSDSAKMRLSAFLPAFMLAGALTAFAQVPAPDPANPSAPKPMPGSKGAKPAVTEEPKPAQTVPANTAPTDIVTPRPTDPPPPPPETTVVEPDKTPEPAAAPAA